MGKNTMKFKIWDKVKSKTSSATGIIVGYGWGPTAETWFRIENSYSRYYFDCEESNLELVEKPQQDLILSIMMDHENIHFREMLENIKSQITECECGAEKCESPKHSEWCDKYEK